MKSTRELVRELDAIKAALQARELSEAELEAWESALNHLREKTGVSSPGLDRDITKLEGLGAEIWQSIDVDEYIRKERESWR